MNPRRWRQGAIAAAGVVVLLASTAWPEGSDAPASTRPDPEGEPTKVAAWIFLGDLDAIDSAKQSITANVYVRLRWHDPRLADKAGRWRTYDLDEVWHPSVLIINRQRGWNTLSETVWVDPNGMVTYGQRYYGKLSNPLDLQDFPFDRHRFEIRLAAIGHGSDEIEFYLDPERAMLGRADRLSVADWEVVQWRAHASPYAPVESEELIAGFVYEFEARRLVSYYVVKVFVPLLLIVLMSWVVFWIDPSHVGPQISVSITSMLTLIAYQFVLSSLLPRVSYITRMDIFLLGSTALVYAALVEVVLTSHLATHERMPLGRRIDTWSRIVFPALFAVVIVWAFVI